MSISVGALVESRGDLAALGRTLAALRTAQLQPDSIAIWAKDFDAEAASWLSKEKVTVLSGHASINHALGAWLSQQQISDDAFVWMLQAGDIPEPDALKALSAAVERAPSLGLLSPKLIRHTDPRIIEEAGLTLTPWGGLFSPASGQLDQAQFDAETDSLAVGNRGLLIRVQLWRALGGFDTRMTPAASVFDISMRARLAGSRVEVVAAARVQVAQGESISEIQKRRSELQLKFAFAPYFLAILFWLLLPIWTLVRVGYQIAYKRLDLIFGELRVGFGAFATPWRLIRLHRSVSTTTRSQFRKLRAGWDEVLSTRAIATATPKEVTTVSATTGANVFWWLAALVVVNFAFWPTDVAAQGGALRPLSQNWLTVFSHAGSGWQSAGFGAAIPAHPINWVLAALSAVTFWQPSLAVGLLLLVSRSLAFWGALRLAGRLGVSGAIGHLAALAFAFWPALTDALAGGSLGAVISIVVSPWLVSSLLATVDEARSRSSWQTQVGLSGLLLAVAVSAAPSSFMLWLLFGLALMMIHLRISLRLVWVLIPMFVIFAPYFWFMAIRFGHPLLAFADPLSANSQPLALWQAALGFNAPLILTDLQPAHWMQIAATAIWLLLLIFAILLSTRRINLLLVGFWMLAGVFAWLLSNTDVANGAQGQNPQVALGLAGLVIIFVIVTALRDFRPKLIGLTMTLLVAPLLVSSFIQGSAVNYGPNRVLPAIVQAQWQQGNNLKVLQLSGSSLVTAELVTPENLTLDGQSQAYQLSAAMRQSSSEAKLLARLAANLVAAGTSSQSQEMSELGIGFVFAPNPTGKLVAALDSSPLLEAVGTTKLGRFWRVADARPSQSETEPSQSQLWSITKSVQFASLVVFGLMALPTAGRTRKRRDTSLDEGELTDAS